MTCVYPKPSSIDWIFAAGQVRFSSFGRDTYPQDGPHQRPPDRAGPGTPAELMRYRSVELRHG